jgi:ubiquinone/menaquinone biosynthesis C-methylase UbiE
MNTHGQHPSSSDCAILSGSLLQETSTRPLGKGYRDIVAFLEPYLSAASKGKTATPTLTASLRSLSHCRQIGAQMRRLPKNPACLLQGYSTPGNAAGLRDFLRGHGVDRPRLWAIDLFDIRAVYEALGIALPEFEFTVADAAALPPLFQDQVFDLVVQDFLLNCLPLADDGKLLLETARVLSPAGCALINFTDATGVLHLPRWPARDLADSFGMCWNEMAYQLSDLTSSLTEDETMRSRLGGCVVTSGMQDQFTYVVPSNGRFEFFSDAARIFLLMKNAGLEPVSVHRSEGVDNNGLRCHRHRCLVRKVTGAS